MLASMGAWRPQMNLRLQRARKGLQMPVQLELGPLPAPSRFLTPWWLDPCSQAPLCAQQSVQRQPVTGRWHGGCRQLRRRTSGARGALCGQRCRPAAASRAPLAHLGPVRSGGCEIDAVGRVAWPRGSSGRSVTGLTVVQGNARRGRSGGGASHVLRLTPIGTLVYHANVCIHIYAVLWSIVELDHDLRRSGTTKPHIFHVVQAAGSVVIVLKSPNHPLPGRTHLGKDQPLG